MRFLSARATSAPEDAGAAAFTSVSGSPGVKNFRASRLKYAPASESRHGHRQAQSTGYAP